MTQGTALAIAAPGVLVNDTVPIGVNPRVELLSPFAPGVLTNVNGTGGFVLDLTGSPGFVGTTTFGYFIRTAVGDSNIANVAVRVDPAPVPADLIIFKADGRDPVESGTTLTYTLTVQNVGGSPANNVLVTDTMPAGLTNVQCSLACTINGSIVTTSLGMLTAGAQVSFTISATAPTVSSSTVITNTVTVSTSSPESSTGNNQASASTTVNPASNQSPTAGFTMTAGAQSATEGQTLIATVPPGTPANVSFDGSRSSDPEDGAASSFEWTLDGQLVSTTGSFASPLAGGMHVISLVVTDSAGLSSVAAQGNIAVQDFPVNVTQVGGGAPVGISRDGSVIVSYSGCLNCQEGGQLFSVPSDGSLLPIPITPSGLSVASAHFGGTKVVFVAQEAPFYGCSNLGCPGDIYAMNPDGTGLVRLTFDGGVNDRGYPFGGRQTARISADGSKIVFNSITYNSLIVMDSNGNNSHPLVLQAVGPNNIIVPSALTSDGSHALYGCIGPGSTTFDSLCVIGTDGTDFRQIVVGAFLRDATLSGDGSTIAYSGDPNGEGIIKVDGTGQPILIGAAGGAQPSLNYDGSVLCYYREVRYSTTDVFCINTDGTNLRNLTTNPDYIESYFPFLSENGALLTFFTATGPAPGTFAAMLRPSLAIDFGPASIRIQNDTFTFSGFGFTPFQPVTRRVRQPNGVELTLTPAMTADAAGKLAWPFPTACSTPTGTYSLWVIDDATGRISNTVTETVTQNPACP